jgi:hypothetical protein
MRRDIAGLRLRRRAAAVALAALTAGGAAGVAGCGSHAATGSAAAPVSASPRTAGSEREASSGKAGRNPLAHSRLRVLTTLDQARLCAALSTAEAARILGTRPQAPMYGRAAGLGIYCRWLAPGAAVTSTDELYVGISSVTDWSGAQAVSRLLHAASVKVDGRQALKAGPLPAMRWAQVDVALGGAHDPVAEYRAPTMAKALAMAQAATPHIISMG